MEKGGEEEESFRTRDEEGKKNDVDDETQA